MSEHWANRYVGLPWCDHGRAPEGCDCYGLVHVIYREELGISLPEYLGYASADEQGEVAALIDGARQLPMWMPVSGTPVAFDLAVFRRGRLTSHVGVVVRRGLMLHMAEDSAKIEAYESGQWSRRLVGLWRHVDLVERAS